MLDSLLRLWLLFFVLALIIFISQSLVSGHLECRPIETAHVAHSPTSSGTTLPFPTTVHPIPSVGEADFFALVAPLVRVDYFAPLVPASASAATGSFAPMP